MWERENGSSVKGRQSEGEGEEEDTEGEEEDSGGGAGRGRKRKGSSSKADACGGGERRTVTTAGKEAEATELAALQADPPPSQWETLAEGFGRERELRSRRGHLAPLEKKGGGAAEGGLIMATSSRRLTSARVEWRTL
jgi:hypothetical protein